MSDNSFTSGGRISPIRPEDLFLEEEEVNQENLEEENLEDEDINEEEEMEIEDMWETPELADVIDFSDGINNCVELALLPSVDLIMGQLIAESVQSGCTVRVNGKILQHNDTKQICFFEYEIVPDIEKGILNTRGGFFEDDTKKRGTAIKEKIMMSHIGDSMNIDGKLFASGEEGNSDVFLMVSSGSSKLQMRGKVNHFPVSGKISYDSSGNITHTGTLSGVKYKRKLILDDEIGGGYIKGVFGDLKEEGQAIFQSDNSILIDRIIGPYHVLQKVVFEKPVSK
ncbi:MAG: hypothetical protein K8T10_15245 [Candidatus Eremiobacteraeota bacterium]|nr:hypothetical protein [Candidatus Eremiobacteraeota bacterium]